MYEETGNKSIALAFNKGTGVSMIFALKNGKFNSDCHKIYNVQTVSLTVSNPWFLPLLSSTTTYNKSPNWSAIDGKSYVAAECAMAIVSSSIFMYSCPC
jgi:hypothetical protein